MMAKENIACQLVEALKIFFGYPDDLDNESNCRPEGSKTVGRGQKIVMRTEGKNRRQKGEGRETLIKIWGIRKI
jgi:hypothetical protein